MAFQESFSVIALMSDTYMYLFREPDVNKMPLSFYHDDETRCLTNLRAPKNPNPLSNQMPQLGQQSTYEQRDLKGPVIGSQIQHENTETAPKEFYSLGKKETRIRIVNTSLAATRWWLSSW